MGLRFRALGKGLGDQGAFGWFWSFGHLEGCLESVDSDLSVRMLVCTDAFMCASCIHMFF